MLAAHTAGPKATAARRRNCHQENPAFSCKTIPIANPAADPAVPGANGKYPHPNQVEMRLANLRWTVGGPPGLGNSIDVPVLNKPIPNRLQSQTHAFDV